MKETLAIVEQLRSERIIGPYAVGGAVAAAFYLEQDHARLVMFVEAGVANVIACAKSSPATHCLNRERNSRNGSSSRDSDLQHIIESKEAERRRLRALPWLEKAGNA